MPSRCLATLYASLRVPQVSAFSTFPPFSEQVCSITVSTFFTSSSAVAGRAIKIKSYSRSSILPSFLFSPGSCPAKSFNLLLPPPAVPFAGCTCSWPHQFPAPPSFPPRRPLPLPSPPQLLARLYASFAARPLCGCSLHAPVRNQAAIAQTLASPATRSPTSHRCGRPPHPRR